MVASVAFRVQGLRRFRSAQLTPHPGFRNVSTQAPATTRLKTGLGRRWTSRLGRHRCRSCVDTFLTRARLQSRAERLANVDENQQSLVCAIWGRACMESQHDLL